LAGYSDYHLMTTLYIATTNAGKLRDFAAAAATSAVIFASLPGLKEIPAPAEDEPSFAGNATVKAVYYSSFAPGEIVIADDSGLEVDALAGAPGVRSARFAADSMGSLPKGSADRLQSNETDNDTLNNLHLLDCLKNVVPGQRQGRYRCVLAAARDGQCLFTADGTVEGEILAVPRGDQGFGYDPLFFLPDLDRTMAEIDLATKHRISHRGRALRSLLAKMEQGLSVRH
jgi:XTP/dITP diphosphohydrolase